MSNKKADYNHSPSIIVGHTNSWIPIYPNKEYDNSIFVEKEQIPSLQIIYEKDILNLDHYFSGFLKRNIKNIPFKNIYGNHCKESKLIYNISLYFRQALFLINNEIYSLDLIYGFSKDNTERGENQFSKYGESTKNQIYIKSKVNINDLFPLDDNGENNKHDDEITFKLKISLTYDKEKEILENIDYIISNVSDDYTSIELIGLLPILNVDFPKVK